MKVKELKEIIKNCTGEESIIFYADG